jgi:hypothetical protein
MTQEIVGSRMPDQPDASLPKGNPRIQNYSGPNPETPLAASLRVADVTRQKVLADGTSGRGDVLNLTSVVGSLKAHDLPADGSMQRRTVSDKSYPLTPGADVRQQDPQKAIGTVRALPLRSARKLSANGMKALSRNP